MLVLNSTSDLFKLQTSAAGAIDVHVSWADVTGTPQVVSPNRTNTAQITTATITTITGSPLASTQRTIKACSFKNSSTTSANTVTPIIYDGTTNTPLPGYTLQPGDALTYDDLTGWKYCPGNNAAQVPGRFLQTTTLVSGTTFTTGHFTNWIRLFMVGGGAGGGGCTSVASAAGAAGGGGAGGYEERWIQVAPDTTYTYAIGSAGAGNSAAAGGNGGDTTFTVGGTTITAKGGTGGPQLISANALIVGLGGAGGVVGSNGDINAPGMAGFPGMVFLVATPVLASGAGGSGQYGAGGAGRTTAGTGAAGTGNGSGGAGGASGASSASTGGAGTVGLIQVDEYS